MWDKKKIHLGAIKAKSRNKIIFQYKGDIKIENIISPCSCTDVEWNKKTGTMTIIYVPKKVPEHIKTVVKRNSYNDIKEIKFDIIELDGNRLSDSLAIASQVFD